jgi:hypothetical protein
MTKSSSFTPVFHQQQSQAQSALDNHHPLKAAGGKVLDDNPYVAAVSGYSHSSLGSTNTNPSPQQRGNFLAQQ